MTARDRTDRQLARLIGRHYLDLLVRLEERGCEWYSTERVT
jgi:hypothetical protein